MYEGHSVQLCLPKTYLDAHAEKTAEVGGRYLTAYENLALVLDTVPGIK